MTPRRYLHAAGVLAGADRWWPDGVVVLEGPRIVCVGPARSLEAQCGPLDQWLDLGDAVLTPGLVNAHAHLELGALQGRCPGSRGLLVWISAVIEALASLEPEDAARGLAEGSRRLLETGTTCVGDIDTLGASAAGLAATGLAGRVYREVLDGRDATRTGAAKERLALRVEPGPAGRVLPGVSPHGPHTASPTLLDAATALARDEASALSVHFAESAAEVEWLNEGSGPLAGLLGSSPHKGALEILEAGGLARAPFSLIHAGHACEEEIARIADLGGVLVHCPGSAEFFGREPAPLAAWLARGARVALGSDSLASNEDLDLRREMALVSRSHPELSPREVFRMATEAGAAALDLVGQVGVLAPGAFGDLAAFEGPSESPAAFLEVLTHERPALLGVWVGGEVC